MTRFVLIALGMLALLLPSGGQAQLKTCVGTITLTYEDPPGRPLIVGDVLHVRGSFGSGLIAGGTSILFNKAQFDLDCDPTIPLVPPCPDIGPIIRYAGDQTIVTDCAGITWTSNNPNGGFLPNHVEFNASPVLAVPANVANPPGFCTLGFDVTVDAVPANGQVGQIIGYALAFCDNGLTSGNFQTAATTVQGEQPNFDCYQVPRGRFSPQQTVPVTNQFADLTVTVNTLHRLCAPSTVDGDPPGVNFDGVHLAAYDIKSVTGPINHQQVTIATALGTRTGTIGALTALAIPTAKSLVSLPPPPPLGVVPPYACFRLTSTSGTAPQNLTTVDQFAVTPLDIERRGPFSLCVASQVGPLAPAGQPPALLCNRTNEDVGFGTRLPFITNLFQSTQVTITQFDELCMPAVIQ